MDHTSTRRHFLGAGTALAAGRRPARPARVGAGQAGPSQPDAEYPRDRPGAGGPVGSPTDRGKLVPGLRKPGLPPVPVETPDLPKLPWTLRDGAKEFHLIAMPVKREFLPHLEMDVWGFNGTMPGPMIEVNQGDRVRIIVENRLPEPTSIHWHSLEIPVSQDGVPGLVQDFIPPGEAFVYEFTLHQHGTFFYHAHVAMQEAMGMVGLFIIHPKEAYEPVCDQDFAADHPGIPDPAQRDDPRQPGDGVQLPDVQRPLRPAHHADRGQAGASGPAPAGELQHGRPSPDPPARPHLVGHRDRGGPHPRIGLDSRATTCWSAWPRRATSSSSPTTRATGSCTAICSTT